MRPIYSIEIQHYLTQEKKVKVLVSHSVMSDSLWLHGLTVAHQSALSMGILQQEYWQGLPFPSPGDRPNPGTEPRYPPLQADSLPTGGSDSK